MQGTPHCWLELRLACEIVKEFMLFKYVLITGFTYASVTQFHFLRMRVKYIDWACVLLLGFISCVSCEYCTVVKRMLYRVLYSNYA